MTLTPSSTDDPLLPQSRFCSSFGMDISLFWDLSQLSLPLLASEAAAACDTSSLWSGSFREDTLALQHEQGNTVYFNRNVSFIYKLSTVPPPRGDFFTVRKLILGWFDRAMKMSHIRARQETGSTSSQAVFKHFLFRHGFHAAKKRGKRVGYN